MRFRMLRATALAFTVTLLAASCAAEDAQPAPSASASISAAPTVKELFGSQEAAEEAALDALNAYWAASAQVYSRPADGPDALGDFVTPDRLEAERAAAVQMVEQGFSTVGAVAVVEVSFQQLFAGADGMKLAVTACNDYSQFGAFKATGERAKNLSDLDRVMQEVEFVIEETDAFPRLLLNSTTIWAEKPC